jgi:hypothetical protein
METTASLLRHARQSTVSTKEWIIDQDPREFFGVYWLSRGRVALGCYETRA